MATNDKFAGDRRLMLLLGCLEIVKLSSAG